MAVLDSFPFAESFGVVTERTRYSPLVTVSCVFFVRLMFTCNWFGSGGGALPDHDQLERVVHIHTRMSSHCKFQSKVHISRIKT